MSAEATKVILSPYNPINRTRESSGSAYTYKSPNIFQSKLTYNIYLLDRSFKGKRARCHEEENDGKC
jgi:hypothetical protein